MGQRKKRFVALVCAVSVIALSGCGDDLTQQVCIPGVEELAQPIAVTIPDRRTISPGIISGRSFCQVGRTVTILHCRNQDSPELRIL